MSQIHLPYPVPFVSHDIIVGHSMPLISGLGGTYEIGCTPWRGWDGEVYRAATVS